MDKRVILAVAGAGKTYHICHTIDTKKKNLILAYTHENIHNIKRELLTSDGQVPELTSVMTFDAFVYRCLVCPYEPTIAECFGRNDFRSKGITTVEPPEKGTKKKGQFIPNHKYINKEQIEHYTTKNNQYYCSRLSELIMYVGKRNTKFLIRATLRLNKFYDQILIDEFQDFREHDYELIISLSNLLNSVVLVGDYYQHSVSAINNSGKPFVKKHKEITYTDFVKELRKLKFNVDDMTLRKSRRCSKEICNFIAEKLGISIESADVNQGIVKWVTGDEIKTILQNPSVVKLVFNGSKQYSFEAINWSYSKGDTVDTACVVLTDKFEKLNTNEFSTQGIHTSTINKLYVALTRSKGDLFLIRASDFKKYKKDYMIR